MMDSRPPGQRRQTLFGSHPVCTSASMEESYEAGEIIGTGSFGVIRKVTRRVDGVVVARKELNYGRMDERDLRQLTEEVNILEQLGSNDNIVRYYERFVDKPNNMLYILMEYCEGGDLSGIIQRCRKTSSMLSEDVVWAYLTQITLALYDCHSETDRNGDRKPIILHRDLKPENVFLDKDNNLKLGDFGLSKAMAQAAMTQTYVGTPYYMSPELINGQPYDVKSDIWALGCLIFELCAGHPPFHEARTQPELAAMVREGKISDLPKPYTPHLGQVVKAMLKQNPKHRPNTAQIRALDNVKLQIRAIELRKATRDLRIRDMQVAQREKDLIARESVVSQREKAVLVQENELRAGVASLREAQTRHSLIVAASQQLSSGSSMDHERENVRPQNGSNNGDVIARVASRPTLVPRRPLDERRSSNAPAPLLPRVSSASSLMSLDDTPVKLPVPSLRRRLASKSMHNLAAAAGFSTLSPTRSSGVQAGPLSKVSNGGGVSESPARPIGLNRSVGEIRSSQTHLSAMPLIPARTATAPPVLPSLSHLDNDDDLPSPFLKKIDGSRFAQISLNTKASTSSARMTNMNVVASKAGRSSIGSRPTMASRLLASRALIPISSEDTDQQQTGPSPQSRQRVVA